ncbi:MAG: SusC/RagA family TonB-linked outer membrane protein, partial [Bacteroidales bacterium]|nr:SusC/RagA family TonB-linked outer membrane protein [Bacteroidales bacterium]
MRKTILQVASSNSFSERKRRILLMLLFLIAGSAILFSQDLLISGRVTDESGEGLPSVSITVKGTTIGTLSNADGSYSISANRNSYLVFSFVGMETQEVLVTVQTTINVTMSTLMVGLDELVVIGYGTQSREKVTASIASVGAEEIEEVPVPTLLKGLQGKIAGVTILQQSGQPGGQPEVTIRGGSSITKGNEPLYIVDGFPRPVGDINPMDIESVDVLKDAAATAIYGARASNGVILITTKSGQKGKAAINFNYTVGFQEFERTIETITAEQFLEIMRPAANASPPASKAYLTQKAPVSAFNDETSTWTTRYLNAGEEVPEGWHSLEDPLDPTKTLVFQDNDLQDKLFKRALMSDYYLSVTGGTDNVTTYTGIGYVNQEGVALSTNYERWTIRNNTSFALSSKVRINTNLDFSSSTTNQFENEANIFTRGVFNNRVIREYFPDGTPGWGENATMVNPEWYQYTRDVERRNQRATLGVSGDWEIINGLHFRPSGNYYFQLYSLDYFEKSHQFNKQRPANFNRDVSHRWQYELLLQYDFKKLPKSHNLSLLAGYSNLYMGGYNASASAYGAATDNIPTLNAAPTPSSASSSEGEELLISQFGRVLYDFEDKYLLSASIRYDGSSKFGSDNKYALFPSFSAGWIISKEPFMLNLNDLFSFMKLRLSYGQTGNNDVGRYTAQGVYAATYPYGANAGIRATQMPNQGLRWEKTSQYGAGIDMRLSRRERIEFSFDYYYKLSDDLLISMQLPRETGFNTIEMNIGSVAFWGYEFTLLTKNISKSDFSWNTEFNIAFTTNEVLSLPERPGVVVTDKKHPVRGLNHGFQ